jgi:hypothetical protein
METPLNPPLLPTNPKADPARLTNARDCAPSSPMGLPIGVGVELVLCIKRGGAGMRSTSLINHPQPLHFPHTNQLQLPQPGGQQPVFTQRPNQATYAFRTDVAPPKEESTQVGVASESASQYCSTLRTKLDAFIIQGPQCGIIAPEALHISAQLLGFLSPHLKYIRKYPDTNAEQFTTI